MTHNRRDPWNPYRADAVPRKAPDMAARPMIGKDETLGLETPEGFDREAATNGAATSPIGTAIEEIAPLALEGFSPQNTILAGALIGWIFAGRRGSKGQGVRVMDVFILGPLMAQAGLWESRNEPWAQALMRAAAGATVTYNLRNFLTTARGR